MSPNEEIREQFGKAAQGLLSGISHRFMRILVRHLAALIESLTGETFPLILLSAKQSDGISLNSEQELPFLMRVIVQSLLAGSPEDLTTEAHALSEATKTKFASVAPEAFGLTETCPACRSTIPLENLLTAACPNGHAWGKPMLLFISYGTAHCNKTSAVFDHFFCARHPLSPHLHWMHSQGISRTIVAYTRVGRE